MNAQSMVGDAAPIKQDEIPWPPGNAGHIAQFIYSNAPRPVREVAIVGALGLLSGMCGRHWSLPGTGLNTYIILVARSAIGKEAMHTGVSTLINAVAKKVPAAQTWVNFADFASGPALVKAVAANQCFVNVAGEFGHKFEDMADRNNAPMKSLRKAMTNLYSKSGPDSTVGGINYSNQEQNIASVFGAAFSMIGESTPRRFYDAITEDMMEDGFMSRFTIVEYLGERPPKNLDRRLVPPEELVDGLAQLAHRRMVLDQQNQFLPIGFIDNAAHQLLDDFEDECDVSIVKAGDDESRRQVWNRAHLKALRIAGLLAVIDNWHIPAITTGHAEWAIGLVRRDIVVSTRRLQSGDIGNDDHNRRTKLEALLMEYVTEPLPDRWQRIARLKENGIVPYEWLQMRTQNLASFKKEKLKATTALRQTIQSLIDAGGLSETPKAKVCEDFGYHGKCYRVLSLPGYEPPRLKPHWIDIALSMQPQK